MATTTFNHSTGSNYTLSHAHTSFFTRFFDWCNAQEYNRLLWVGVTLVTHGCIITPIAVLAIVLSGVGAGNKPGSTSHKIYHTILCTKYPC
jgi:hypothetical protein